MNPIRCFNMHISHIELYESIEIHTRHPNTKQTHKYYIINDYFGDKYIKRDGQKIQWTLLSFLQKIRPEIITYILVCGDCFGEVVYMEEDVESY